MLRRLNKKKMGDDAIMRMHSDIINTVAYETSISTGSWSDIVKSDDIQSRRRFFIACGIQAMQQLGGKGLQDDCSRRDARFEATSPSACRLASSKRR